MSHSPLHSRGILKPTTNIKNSPHIFNRSRLTPSNRTMQIIHLRSQFIFLNSQGHPSSPPPTPFRPTAPRRRGILPRKSSVIGAESEQRVHSPRQGNVYASSGASVRDPYSGNASEPGSWILGDVCGSSRGGGGDDVSGRLPIRTGECGLTGRER